MSKTSRLFRVARTVLYGALVAFSGLIAPASASDTEVAPTSTRPFVLFSANHPTRLCDIYQSDGTAAGTFRAFDLVNAYDVPNCGELFEVVGLGRRTIAVMTSADDASVTRPGIYALNPGAAPTRLGGRGLNGALYLRILAVEDGRALILVQLPSRSELWQTDGTMDGTQRAISFAGRPISHSIVVGVFRLGGAWTMLTAEYIQDPAGSHGRLYRLDLEAGTATPLLDFPRDGGRFSHFSERTRDPGRTVAVVGPDRDRVVFWRETRSRGLEPWVSDGTRQGTGLLRDINPGLEGSSLGGTFFIPFGDGAVFAALHPVTGSDLWFTDGTRLGTRLLRDIGPGDTGDNTRTDQMVQHNGLLYFVATHGADRGLWVTDGTRRGTQRVATRVSGRLVGIGLIIDRPHPLAVVSGNIVFSGTVRQGDCPSFRPWDDPRLCRYENGIYRYNPETGRTILAARTSQLSCQFQNAHVRFLYNGGTYASLMAFGNRLLFAASGREAESPTPVCATVQEDMEPWSLRNRDAAILTQIAPGLLSSDPLFIGSSLCSGRC